MDKALNQLSVPLGQLREEVLVLFPIPFYYLIAHYC